MPDTSMPQVLIIPLRPAQIYGVAQKLPVLVRVQAPDPDPATTKQRQPYHLSLVIDRSGSMSGEPLLQAVRCARLIIDRLDATDVASLVVFDDRVNTLEIRLSRQNRWASATQSISRWHRIHCGGSTNLQGGWKAGRETLLPQAGKASQSRVILLFDDNANVGETTATEDFAACCAEAAEQGISSSTYGLGRDFNEPRILSCRRRIGHYAKNGRCFALTPPLSRREREFAPFSLRKKGRG